MKIMFVIPSLGSGGAERVVSLLANSFCRSQHSIVIVLVANDNIDYAVSEQVKIINISDKWKSKRFFLNKIIKRISCIHQVVKSESPDVVISFMAETNIDTSIALIGCSTTLVVSERNDPSIDPQSRVKKLIRNIVYFRPEGFVFQTKEAKEFFGEKIQERSTIILNPLESKLPEKYTGVREKKIVAVGRLEEQKNYPMLLEAFDMFHRRKPDFILEIFGDGSQKQTIKRIIEERKLNDCVKLMGFCNNVHERINRSTMFVMSSNYEGMPNALIEAMALGLPCVSTDCPCGGPRSIIENKINGILIPVGDTIGLAEAMTSIVDNEKYKDMGEKAQEIRSRVELKNIADQWMTFISKISR